MRTWMLLLLVGCAADSAASRDSTNLAMERGSCHIAGCSQTICTSQPEDVVTTCEWRPEYQCYRSWFSICEVQKTGACGWTPSDAMQGCLADPPDPS